MTDIDAKSAIVDAADALSTATKGVNVNAIPPAWFVAVSVLGASILIAKAIGAAAEQLAAIPAGRRGDA